MDWWLMWQNTLKDVNTSLEKHVTVRHFSNANKDDVARLQQVAN